MVYNKSNYNKDLKPFARKLRNNSTLGEIILWSKVLRAKRMRNYQFNRQFSMKFDDLNIIVDFICRKLKLVIEVDGDSHNFKLEKDKIRDEKLNKFGYTVLRIDDSAVKLDIDNVKSQIEQAICELEKHN